jgi:ribosomal protein S3
MIGLRKYFEKRKIKKELHSPTPKRIRRWMQQFFENEDIVRCRLEITAVDVKIKRHKITVTVTLGRPGLLIGKAGRTIDALKAYLEKIAEREVEIKIKESKLWW